MTAAPDPWLERFAARDRRAAPLLTGLPPRRACAVQALCIGGAWRRWPKVLTLLPFRRISLRRPNSA
jgi:hypothetical protein